MTLGASVGSTSGDVPEVEDVLVAVEPPLKPSEASAKERPISTPPSSIPQPPDQRDPLLTRLAAALAAPTLAFLAALMLFGVFITLTGHSPFQVYYQMYRGSFGTWFSFQNTLLRSAPLMLTA